MNATTQPTTIILSCPTGHYGLLVYASERGGQYKCPHCARPLHRPGQHVPQPRVLLPCGTRAAYRRHLADGETTCDPCREASRIYRQADRIRLRAERRR